VSGIAGPNEMPEKLYSISGAEEKIIFEPFTE